MENSTILSHVDYTLLKATASWGQIQELCDKALEHKTASVCIPSAYVKRAHDTYGAALNVCTVIGFPLGYTPTNCKVLEAKQAVEDGAHEVDMVINIGDIKNGDFAKVEQEVKAIKQAVGTEVLKVIIETCYLTEQEKIELCKIVTSAGAEYIKTSTGFGTAGATLADVALFKKHIGPQVKIKAAGGVRTREEMQAYIEAGCERIGASNIDCLV